MRKWEYLTLYLQADAKAQLEELRKRFPQEHGFANFSPRALIPELDKLGDEGWELVSASPVEPGSNDDIHLFAYGTYKGTWTHTYLCIFKRPKE